MKNSVHDVTEVGHAKNEPRGNKPLLSKIAHARTAIISARFRFSAHVIFESGGLAMHKINRGVAGLIRIQGEVSY